MAAKPNSQSRSHSLHQRSLRATRAGILFFAAVLSGSSPVLAVIPPGAMPAPTAPATAASFPKRISARGPGFAAWEQAMVFSHSGTAGYYASPSVQTSANEGLTSLVEFDHNGNTVRSISPMQLGTTIYPADDIAYFHAERRLAGAGGAAGQIEFGRYSKVNYAPVFQHRLEGDAAKTSILPGLSDGRFVVTQDRGDAIEISVFSANGAAQWARRLTSSFFGVTPAPIPTETQSAYTTALPDGGVLVHVSKYKFNFDTFSQEYSSCFIKLSAAGAVEWARRPAGTARVSGFSVEGDSLLMVTAIDADPMSGTLGASAIQVSRLTLGGATTWSKKLTGPALNVVGNLPGGKILLSGFVSSLETPMGATVLAVMGPGGTLDAKAQFAFDRQNFTMPSVEGSRIWLGTVSGGELDAISDPGPTYIGLTDASLSSIQWKRYKNNSNFATVSPHPLTDHVVASFMITNAHAAEAVTLKDDFSVNAACELFSDVATPLVAPDLTIADATTTLTDVAVTAAPFAPALSAANLTFETMPLTETSVCNGGGNGGGGGNPFAIIQQPVAVSAAAGSAAMFSVAVNNPTGEAVAYQWRLNGKAIAGATGSSLTIPIVQSSHVGAYSVTTTVNGTTLSSAPATLSMTITQRISGDAAIVASDLQHPNGNIYDQFLLTGPSATVTADPGQVSRISFIDLNDDIVQVEFSGAGYLTITLANASGPFAPVNYNQAVSYMKGHATLTFTGTNETSHLSFFSVGSITALNQALFKPGVNYDGIADIALVNIAGVAGKFGGLRAGNGAFFAVSGDTGINAPGVDFDGQIILHDVDARETSTPKLLTGQVAGGEIRITGGDLGQPNSAAIELGGAAKVRMAAGTTSHGGALNARPNQGVLERNGQNVTQNVIINP